MNIEVLRCFSPDLQKNALLSDKRLMADTPRLIGPGRAGEALRENMDNLWRLSVLFMS